jgi:hypothetical protein
MDLASEDARDPIRLTPQEEEELSAAMDEIRRGELIDGKDLIAELRAMVGPANTSPNQREGDRPEGGL